MEWRRLVPENGEAATPFCGATQRPRAASCQEMARLRGVVPRNEMAWRRLVPGNGEAARQRHTHFVVDTRRRATKWNGVISCQKMASASCRLVPGNGKAARRRATKWRGVVSCQKIATALFHEIARLRGVVPRNGVVLSCQEMVRL
eukprot:CAMPEP_0171342084 /NCGR_PEP_ID=MMETSP0878-20121228/13213_1 /TAXON_ID=67004 /ORGANISM="Thalassiosira weissflogii, Strain CCMP1336" /LENGTH=145 /DNA_ID=CAMNT_0011844641 /DNA_START=37 /DNA_END=474 /DNA_ORIENTATION=+